MNLYRVQLCIAAFVFCALLAWVIAPSQQADVKKLEALVTSWKAQPEDVKQSRKLKKALKHSPLKWDVAQAALALGVQVESVDEASLKGLSQVSSLHAEYSKVSLLIGRKRYQEALEKTVSLKEKLDPTSLLFAESLVRLGFLHAELGNLAGERAAWEEWERFSHQNPSLAAKVCDKSALSAYIIYRTKGAL